MVTRNGDGFAITSAIVKLYPITSSIDSKTTNCDDIYDQSCNEHRCRKGCNCHEAGCTLV